MKIAFLQSLKSLWHKFQKDESGIALIYITAALPVIIGFSLLAIDVGRLATLQSTLQHGTDALALAGAGELDRRPDAITRATNAINALLGADTTHNNKSLFATSVATVSVGTPCFLQTLPASDVTAITNADCLPVANATQIAASSPNARYVQVTATPASFSTIFPVNFSGAAVATAGATAVAGFDAAVCNFTPIFMCNPLEPANNSDLYNDFGLSAMANSYSTRRDIIKFLGFTGGGNVTAVPGQFGFLQVPGAHGANDLRDEISAISPHECYLQTTISTQPGSKTGPAISALNTRFDLYAGSLNSPSATYPPAINVRKGYVPATNGNATNKICNAAAGTSTGGNKDTNPNNSQVMAFPIDSCFSTNTCANTGPYNNANIGNGDWGWNPDVAVTNSAAAFRTASGKTGYWDLNFIGTSNNSAIVPPSPDTPYSNANPPSRYDLYRYEISQGYYNRYSVTGTTSPGVETGLPNCAILNNVSGVDTTTGSVDRRIIYGAVMNCKANDLRPGSNGIYYAFAFAKFFMVRPVDSSNILWAELVDLVYPGDGSGVARDRVQLYR